MNRLLLGAITALIMVGSMSRQDVIPRGRKPTATELRYIPPTYLVSMSGLLLKPQLVHQQRTTTSNGATASKIVALPVWKIEGALGYRSAIVHAAIVYVAKKRDETTDPVIRQNAEKTLGILKRMLHRGPRASAC